MQSDMETITFKKVRDLLFIGLHSCNTLEEMKTAELEIYELIMKVREKGETREKKREDLAERRKQRKVK